MEGNLTPRDLDPIIHERTRLGILSLLVIHKKLSFQTIKEELNLTDGNLAQHLRTLEEEGLVEVEKTFVDRRPRTIYKLTRAGKKRLENYLKKLEIILSYLNK